MVQLPYFYRGVLEGLGLAGRADVLNLYAARAARGFGDGFAAIILPAYLLEIGFGPFQIGLVATAALQGSAATTPTVGFLAPLAARLCRTDGGDRDRNPKPAASRLHCSGRLYRHNESDDGGHWSPRSARTGRARAPGIGQGADAGFRPL
jgi:hypothetical protein